jgi:hypothetical protein
VRHCKILFACCVTQNIESEYLARGYEMSSPTSVPIVNIEATNTPLVRNELVRLLVPVICDVGPDHLTMNHSRTKDSLLMFLSDFKNFIDYQLDCRKDPFPRSSPAG